MGEVEDTKRVVTPAEATLAGAAVLVAAAVAAGGAHFVGSAKKLAEEGVEARARVQAMPLAIKALAASTLMCVVMAGVGAAGWKLLGGEARPAAGVATIPQALALAKQQRVSRTGIRHCIDACFVIYPENQPSNGAAWAQDLVRKEMRAAVFGEDGAQDAGKARADGSASL
jgi:hypothetical protein